MPKFPTGEEITAAIEQLFEATRRHSHGGVLSAFVPVDRVQGSLLVTYGPDYEMHETCEFVHDCHVLLSNAEAPDSRARIMASAYFRIMEADYPLTVIWNLLGMQLGLPCRWTFTRRTKKGEEVPCRHPGEKITEIVRLSATGNSTVGPVLERLWDADLRNTFAHSQYMLMDGNYMGTRAISPLSRQQSDTVDSRDCYYSFDDLSALFSSTYLWLTSFVQTYKREIAPFKDGRDHELKHGAVYWDALQGRWLWSANRQGRR